MDRIYLQSGLEESFFNSLRGKQIDHHMYILKSHMTLKKCYVTKSTRGWSIYLLRSGLEDDSSKLVGGKLFSKLHIIKFSKVNVFGIYVVRTKLEVLIVGRQ